MAHKFVIEKNKAGEYVAKFKYNAEVIFWTEGYASKASAKNAIESILTNGPGAPIDED
ncbi:YegP family protein [soil metagenome]